MSQAVPEPKAGADEQVGAIVVAAGAGRRFGGDKIFARLADRPVLAHAVEAFEAMPAVATIVVVLAADNLERGRRLARERGWAKLAAVCAGGARRQDSVVAGLRALPAAEWVIVHDGARPLVTPALIEEGLAAARRAGAAIAAMPAKDTLKLVDAKGLVEGTLDRARVWLVQTPQVFRRDLLTAAHGADADDVTDDAALLERLGIPVAVYRGSDENLKITTPSDLLLAECLLRQRR